jgi:hypothetical protein
VEKETNSAGLGTNSAAPTGYDKYNPVYEEIKAVQPLQLPDQQGLSPAGDYDIIQCPAYIPVTHGNEQDQQAENSLVQPENSSEMSGSGPGTCND